MVDYGCGSGILGIAALRLGAKRCLAVDIDPRARETACANAARNGVTKVFDTMPPQAIADSLRRVEPAGADVLVANILADTLVSLAGAFKDLVARGGELMLAGMLAGQENGLIEAHAPWFRLEVAAREQDWILLAGPRTRRLCVDRE